MAEAGVQAGGLRSDVKEARMSVGLWKARPGLQEFVHPTFTEHQLPASHYPGRLGHTNYKPTMHCSQVIDTLVGS